MDFAPLVQTIAINALPVLFAITLHEAARGYAARYLGDNTAWMLGRVSLNPAKHIDPVGTILMPLLLYFATSGAFLFGYAKPVPVRLGNLRNPKRDMIWVALAGPAANLIQGLVWGALLYILQAAGVNEPFFLKVCQAGVGVNVSIFAFTLFPVPPLAGGRVLLGLLPDRQALLFSLIEPWGFFIVMALVLTGLVSTYWMQPLMSITFSLLNALLTPLSMLLH